MMSYESKLRHARSRFLIFLMLLLSFQPNCRWLHVSNRVVSLESAHLLLLHELERVALQKIALQKLNKSDLGTTIRIPKGALVVSAMFPSWPYLNAAANEC